MIWKQARKQNDISRFLNSKTNIHKSPNHPQIESNPVNYHLESMLLPWSSRVAPRCKNGFPGCAQGAKMVPQNVKMEAPSPLNGNPRSQKGPAAEGVALKIKISEMLRDGSPPFSARIFSKFLIVRLICLLVQGPSTFNFGALARQQAAAFRSLPSQISASCEDAFSAVPHAAPSPNPTVPHSPGSCQ